MADRASLRDATDPQSAISHARSALSELQARDLHRQRHTVQHWAGTSAEENGPAEPIAIVDGELKLAFCSNDYLGLSRDPRVVAAFQAAASRHGVGSGASHLVTGHHREHHALEEALAAYVGRERALLFANGYLANLGVVSTLLARRDTVLEDRLNHASLVDAAILSRARLARYAHADAAAAEAALARIGASQSTGFEEKSRVLLVTDGVFSMDGDTAPLPELAASTRRHGAWLMVDDAHGLGVVGPGGRGTAAAMTSSDVPLLMGTLGKAFGTYGAFVAGDHDVIELLVQKARTYIYTTALPPAVAAAAQVSLRIATDEEYRRTRLAANVSHFRSGARQIGFGLLESDTPIQPIVLGSSARALAASDALWERGFWVSAIRPPTVPEGTARLRVTLSAGHTHAQVDSLLQALADVIPATDEAVANATFPGGDQSRYDAP